MKFVQRFIYLLCLLVPTAALAQIYECGGTFTNKPCGPNQPVLEEKPYNAPSAAALDKRKRDFILEDLELARLKANREYNLSFDISSARQTCESEPLPACLQAVTEAERSLNQAILDQLSIAEKKKALEEQRTPQAQQPIHITIIRPRERKHTRVHRHETAPNDAAVKAQPTRPTGPTPPELHSGAASLSKPDES